MSWIIGRSYPRSEGGTRYMNVHPICKCESEEDAEKMMELLNDAIPECYECELRIEDGEYTHIIEEFTCEDGRDPYCDNSYEYHAEYVDYESYDPYSDDSEWERINSNLIPRGDTRYLSLDKEKLFVVTKIKPCTMMHQYYLEAKSKIDTIENLRDYIDMRIVKRNGYHYNMRIPYPDICDRYRYFELEDIIKCDRDIWDLSQCFNWDPILIDILKPRNNRDEWYWCDISQYCDPKYVESHPNLPWNLRGLSKNDKWHPKLLDSIKLCPNTTESWDWELITEYCDPMHIIENKSLPWNLYSIYRNHNWSLRHIVILDAISLSEFFTYS